MPSHLSSPSRVRRASAVLLTGVMLAALPVARALHAQDSTTTRDSANVFRGFRVAAVTGYQTFDKSAALKASPLVGVRITGRQLGPVVLGVDAAFSRPVTRGEYFPYNLQIYFSDQARRNDTTIVYSVSQRVTMATYGVNGGLRFGGNDASTSALGRVAIDIGGGAGAYTFWLDPEQSRSNRTVSGTQFSLGGGLSLPLGRTSALHLRADDMIFTNFRRERFSLSDPLFRDELFANLQAPPPVAKSTVHNPRFSVAFSFIPGTGAR